MKIMVVLDHLRPSYADKDGNFIFVQTQAGKLLTKYLTAPRVGLGLDLETAEISMEFAYPQIPEIKASGKLGDVTKAMGKPYFERLHQKIVEQQPELILSFGNIALLGLTGKKKIDQRRGQPIQQKFTCGDDTFNTWIIPLYGLENVLMDSVKKGLMNKDLQLVKKFIKDGPESLSSGLGTYKFINDFAEVQRIFADIFAKKYPVVAFDIETNTLHGEYQNVPDHNDPSKMVSAKPLMFSMSWEEKQGVTILLDHKDAVWTGDQLNHIYAWVRQLLESDQWKVLHNGKFDIKFLKQTIGLKRSVNCLDTMMMYYVSVSEETNVSKGLKQLALQYTNMGGYEDVLNEYKRQYLADHYQTWIDSMEKRKAETGEKYFKKDYVPKVNEIDGGTFNYEWIPLSVIEPYAAADTDATLRIYNVLKPTVNENPEWAQLLARFYPRLQDALSEMEKNGMYLDADYAKKIRKVYVKRRNELVEKIREIPEVQEYEQANLNELAYYEQERDKKPADRLDKIRYNQANKLRGKDNNGELKYHFKPTSGPQKNFILYHELGYSLPYKPEYLSKKTNDDRVKEEDITWRNYSSDSNAMQYLVDTYDSELAKLLIDYTKVEKALNSFIDKLPALRDPKGTIHTRFNMAGTVTGRLSSSGDYNAQQLPRRIATPSEFGYEVPIKGMFKSRFKDGVILNIDFKTLEVYIAALLSGDEKMIQALLNGGDFHTQNARNIFNIPENEPVPKDERTNAKSVTFGLMYGETAMGMAAKQGITVDKAQGFINNLMKAYPGLEATINQAHFDARNKGHVQTMAGLWRRLGTVGGSDRGASNRAMRQSFNAIVQGSGAYCTNTAVIMLWEYFQKYHFRSLLIATVHDSIVVDVYPDEILQVAQLCEYVFSHLPIQKVMRNPKGNLKVPAEWDNGDGTYRFPLHGECEIGANYNDDVEFDPELIKKFNSLQAYCRYQYAKLTLKEKRDNKLLSEDDYDHQVAELEAGVYRFMKVKGEQQVA